MTKKESNNKDTNKEFSSELIVDKNKKKKASDNHNNKNKNNLKFSNKNNPQAIVSQDNKKIKIIILTIIITVFVLIFFIFGIIGCTILVFSSNTNNIDTGNTAVIPINGEISVSGNGGFFNENLASSKDIVQFIQDADADPSIKAIIIEINSPGGSGVASEEIANALKKSKKTKVAWIREIGTSGAYWIASSCDYIIASRFSITGSVGVLSSYIDFAGLLERYNISYEKITGGKYKDIGSPFRSLSEEERNILQQKVDLLHYSFLSEIVKNRKLNNYQKNEISTALFYTGEEALNLGLIDELGGKQEVINYIEKHLSIKVKEKHYLKRKSLSDLLNNLIYSNSYHMGRGIGDSITKRENLKNNIIIT